eukprot:1157664-Pelagomonas_calceolata.AAC.9
MEEHAEAMQTTHTHTMTWHAVNQHYKMLLICEGSRMKNGAMGNGTYWLANKYSCAKLLLAALQNVPLTSKREPE